jgi:hypothetical protein
LVTFYRLIMVLWSVIWIGRLTQTNLIYCHLSIDKQIVILNIYFESNHVFIVIQIVFELSKTTESHRVNRHTILKKILEKKLIMSIHFFTLKFFCIQTIVHRGPMIYYKTKSKWCFIVIIVTLFHFSTMLKVHFKSYILLLTHVIFTLFYYM